MNENKNDIHPDLSGLFEIDENDIPSEIIKKDPSSKPAHPPVLNSDEALKELPKEARKAIKKDKKQQSRKRKTVIAKKKLITAVSVIVSVILGLGIIGYLVTEAQKPVVYCEKPVKESISVHSDAIGVTYPDGAGMSIVFIDNEYDTHSIVNGLRAELTAVDIKTSGTVYAIKEEQPDSELIINHYSILKSGSGQEETLPGTAVYTVYIKPDSDTDFPVSGKPVSVKVLTKTSEDTLTVPSSAIMTDETGTYVWVYSSWSKSLSKKPITTGIISDGKTEITSGIKKSNRVVYNYDCDISELTDGVKVKVK